jgi:hypothetical protein
VEPLGHALRRLHGQPMHEELLRELAVGLELREQLG